VQNGSIFRLEFYMPRHGRLPKRDTILKMANDFRVRGSSEFSYSALSVSTSENVKGARNAVQQNHPAHLWVILRYFKHYCLVNFTQEFELLSLKIQRTEHLKD
jgi:hypothetical protein